MLQTGAAREGARPGLGQGEATAPVVPGPLVNGVPPAKSGQQQALVEAPPHAGKHFDGYDLIPWGLTTVGIMISLAWNYFNYRRMKKFQRELRQETVRLEEFRRVRTPIDAALVELRPLKETLKTLASSGLTLAKIRSDAGVAQKELTEKYLNLQTALEEADASKFAEGTDWLAPVDQIWDQVVSIFDVVHNPKRNTTEARAALVSGAAKLSEMTRLVTGRIDQEVGRYAGGGPRA